MTVFLHILGNDKMKNHELQKLTSKEYNNGNYDKAILAVGSCESHGNHLPHGTDTFVAHKLSKLIAKEVEDLLVLPPLTIGYSAHYDAFPFTISLGYDTMIQVLYDILESTIRAGIDRIVIINGHDGNIAPIEVASRMIKEVYPESKIVSLNEWWIIAAELIPEGTFEVWNGGGHGGEGESSIGYYLFPEYTDPDEATCCIPDNLSDVLDIKWNFDEITDTAQTGDATVATKEKGRLMTEALTEAVVNAIKELDEKDWDYRTNSLKEDN